MSSTGPLTESNKKVLHDIKSFAELVQTFSKKIGGSRGEKRPSPIVLFVKNYLRHYSVALIDQVIDLEFRNSSSLFERNKKSLLDALTKLNNSYVSTFQDEQIAEYANMALQESINSF